MSSRPSSVRPRNDDAHAARVRDNQRRSRARRQEYLHELEARVRKCQEDGVQANMELQVAARRVVEENRLLHALLQDMGLQQQDVDARLAGLRGDVEAAAGGGGACAAAPMPSGGAPAAAPVHVDARPEAAAAAELDLDALEPLLDLDFNAYLQLGEDEPPLPPTNPLPTNLVPANPANPAIPSIEELFCCPPGPGLDVDRDSSTPCSVAYKLLRALNARQETERDMFSLFLELWQGFSAAPPDDPEGCRVDDGVLFGVVQKMVEGPEKQASSHMF